MQNFLPIDLYFPAHPKTLRLTKLAGPGAAGHLILLWIWAAKNRPDGNLTGMDNDYIERSCEWAGQAGRFVMACREAGYFDGADDDYRLHDWAYWQRHYSQITATRKSSERVRQHRARKRQAGVTERFTAALQPVTRTIVTPVSGQCVMELDALHVTDETPRLDKIREEKIIKEQEQEQAAPPKPQRLDQWMFDRWLERNPGAKWNGKEWKHLKDGIGQCGSEERAKASWLGFLDDGEAFYAGHYPSKWSREPVRWPKLARMQQAADNTRCAATEAYEARKAAEDARLADYRKRLNTYDPVELAAIAEQEALKAKATRNGNASLANAKGGVFLEVLRQRAQAANVSDRPTQAAPGPLGAEMTNRAKS